MKKKSIHYTVLTLVFLLSLTIKVHAQQINNITSGYVANTFSGDNGKWVQNFGSIWNIVGNRI